MVQESDVDPFSVVSLFAGAGGLDMGFESQGFRIVWANDINEDACETHRKWSKATVVQGDISKLEFSAIPRAGVIIGGFPCQGFSLAGPRRIDDERNKLYKFFVELVEEKQPYVFVAENVKGLLTLGEGLILEAIIQDFSDRGYAVFPTLVNAADYAVPQERWRVIMIGFRKDLGITDYKFRSPLPFEVKLSDALKGVPPPSEEDVSRDAFSSRYMSRNRKRGWNEVSYTIPAMGKQVTLHPSSPDMVKISASDWKFGDLSEGETRRLSWQEAAAIQTFPPVEFVGNLTSKYMQIGNAVPVRLAKVIAADVRRQIEGSLIYRKDRPNLVAKQTEAGKAFEYACLQSLRDYLGILQEVIVEKSPAMSKARDSYFSTEIVQRRNLDLAADAATRFLIRYEPNLQYPEANSSLILTIQGDSMGQKGDVRDIVCLRNKNGWEIGISCKHNHTATKHPRLSQDIDFGEEWLDRPCSRKYFEEIKPAFDGLLQMKENELTWKEAKISKEDKWERYYIPVLNAFEKELERIYNEGGAEISQSLIKYLIGNKDFYKVMSNETNRTTDIQAFNINGTLNKSAGMHKPESKFDKICYPDRIIEIKRGKESKTTTEITMSNGWALALRIHSASGKVEPSLKFDVQFGGLPPNLKTKTEPWDK